MAFAAPTTALEQKPRKARWYDAYPNVKLAVQLLQVSPRLGAEISVASELQVRQRRANDGCSPWAAYLATLQHQPEAFRVRLAHQWAEQVLTSL